MLRALWLRDKKGYTRRYIVVLGDESVGWKEAYSHTQTYVGKIFWSPNTTTRSYMFWDVKTNERVLLDIA